MLTHSKEYNITFENNSKTYLQFRLYQLAKISEVILEEGF